MFSENKVMKNRLGQQSLTGSSPASPSDLIVTEEMQELLCKLRELVPYMPRNKKLSKLEIIQNVIDYIFDLQQALDNNMPASDVVSDQRQQQPQHVSSSPFASSSFRQPLSTLSYPSV